MSSTTLSRPVLSVLLFKNLAFPIFYYKLGIVLGIWEYAGNKADKLPALWEHTS